MPNVRFCKTTVAVARKWTKEARDLQYFKSSVNHNVIPAKIHRLLDRKCKKKEQN